MSLALNDSRRLQEPNPLDTIEEILQANNWEFDRMDDESLMVTLAGGACDYALVFLWNEEFNALQLCVQYNLEIHAANIDKAAHALMSINERLWMGHFEISSDDHAPSFRYTYLLDQEDNAMSEATHERLERIVDIALAQCENNYSAFHLLASEHSANDDALPLALIETQGSC